MVIVDTSVWIDYLKSISNAHTRWLDQQLERIPIALTDLILCEVMQGTRDEQAAQKTRNALEEFYVAESCGEHLAIAAAQNYRLLRSKGATVRGTIDCLIATFCLIEGHSLLHRDRDYDAFETHLGLRVIHP
jgi:predicted nucleic acid-binding protein